MEFLFRVAEQEPSNRMTAYNLAVTVGPNLFRQRMVSAQDMQHCSAYCEAIVRMIERQEVLFDKEMDCEQLFDSLQDPGVQSIE